MKKNGLHELEMHTMRSLKKKKEKKIPRRLKKAGLSKWSWPKKRS